ncbi:uncharacterized protein LOC144152011 [Haemaphysalis longicornis]
MFWKVEEKWLGLRSSVIFLWWTSTTTSVAWEVFWLGDSETREDYSTAPSFTRPADKKTAKVGIILRAAARDQDAVAVLRKRVMQLEAEMRGLRSLDMEWPASSFHQEGTEWTWPAAPCQHEPCRTTSTRHQLRQHEPGGTTSTSPLWRWL